jgi:replication initiation and membrane attachment protein DnaB
LSEVHIRKGDVRSGFTMIYHEIFDLYHPYIGDKATLYYLYLLRYRNNDEQTGDYGKAWRGRKGVVEKFQLSYSTLPLLDDILEASGLIAIETKPIGRGREKIYYVVHDPLERERFREREEAIVERLRKLVAEKPDVAKLLGKENKAKVTDV